MDIKAFGPFGGQHQQIPFWPLAPIGKGEKLSAGTYTDVSCSSSSSCFSPSSASCLPTNTIRPSSSRPNRTRRERKKQLNGGTAVANGPKKRKKCVDKERIRNLEIKQRLQELTQMMPFIDATELPRIRILRLANQYILHLQRMLEGRPIFCEKTHRWRPLEKEDFAQIVSMEMQIKNSYSHRVDEEGELPMADASLGANSTLADGKQQ